MAALTPLSKARAAWRVLLPADRLACSSVCPFQCARRARRPRCKSPAGVSVACLLHVCFVLFFPIGCPGRQEPPRRPLFGHCPTRTQRRRKSSSHDVGEGTASAGRHRRLRATRARRRCRWRCAPGRLRRAFERVVSASGGGPSSSGSSGRQRCARQVGGWRPSVKARECGGGGAWRWRRVKGREGAYGGRRGAQRSRRRRRASRMRVGGDNLRTLPG